MKYTNHLLKVQAVHFFKEVLAKRTSFFYGGEIEGQYMSSGPIVAVILKRKCSS